MNDGEENTLQRDCKVLIYFYDFGSGGSYFWRANMAKSAMKKFVAVMVAGSMVFALAACGRPTPEEFKESAIKKLEAKEVDIDDLEDIQEDKEKVKDFQDDLEDGIVIYATGDDLEDMIDDEEDLEERKEQTEKTLDELKDHGIDVEEILGFDPSDWDIDDIEDMTIYAIGDDVEDKKKSCVEGAVVLQFVDKEEANEAFEGIATNYVEKSGIDLKELNKGEIVSKGKSVQFILNGDSDLIGDLIVDLMALIVDKTGMDEDLAKEEIKEAKSKIKESIDKDVVFTFGLYYNNGTMTIIYGYSMSGDLDNIPEIAKILGVTDPTTVEMSDAMYDGLIDFVDESISDDLLENLHVT